MKYYYSVKIFDDSGNFVKTDLEYHINKNRKNFLIYLPKNSNMSAILEAGDYLAKKKVAVCIHDLSFLHGENDVDVGRGIQKIFMFIQKGVHVESLSYHLGSLYGFGKDVIDLIIEDHLRLDIPPELEKERFLCAVYGRQTYKESIDTLLEYLFNISQFAYKNNLTLLIKNLALDYIYVSEKYKNHFQKQGYKKTRAFSENDLGLIPKLVEKGEFPRTAKEMNLIAEMYDMKIALDVEHLLFQTLHSQKYNIQNDDFMKKWNIQITNEDEKMLYKYGFTVKIGAPLIYEKPLDLIDEIFTLKDNIFIAHVSGSVGPVFIDKADLKEEDVTTEMLLGILKDDDIKYAKRGKEQVSSYAGVLETEFEYETIKIPSKEEVVSKEEILDIENEEAASSEKQIEVREENKGLEEEKEETFVKMKHKKIFEHAAPTDIWKKMFEERFSETLFTLNKINCPRLVQKVRQNNENVNETLKMFQYFVSKFGS